MTISRQLLCVSVVVGCLGACLAEVVPVDTAALAAVRGGNTFTGYLCIEGLDDTCRSLTDGTCTKQTLLCCIQVADDGNPAHRKVVGYAQFDGPVGPAEDPCTAAYGDAAAGAPTTWGPCHWEGDSAEMWVKANGVNLNWRTCLQVQGTTGSCVAKTPFSYVKCAQLWCYFDEASCRQNSMGLRHGDRLSADCQTSQQ